MAPPLKAGNLLSKILLYGFCSHKHALKIALPLLRKILQSGNPSISTPLQFLLKNTVYRQFCAGENLTELIKVKSALERSGLNCIVDYAVEFTGTDQDSHYFLDDNYSTIRNMIEKLSLASDSSIALKMSSLVPYNILKDISKELLLRDFSLDSKLLESKLGIFWDRLLDISTFSATRKVNIMIDAENLAIQPAIDYFALVLMSAVPQNTLINTYQLYLTNANSRLRTHLEMAKACGFSIGLKVVRGAYLNQDRNLEMGSYGPILPNIESVHEQYDQCVQFILEKGLHLYPITKLCIASHNDNSIQKATNLLMNCPSALHDKVMFAQLYGMGDYLSEQILKTGQNVSKYLPFGPIRLTVPYMMRRLEENTGGLNMRRDLQEEFKYYIDSIKRL